MKCAKVSPALYECIERGGGLSNFHCNCASCEATFQSLENITSILKENQFKNDKRMSNLEERISKLEKNSNEELKSNVQSMKGEIIDSIRNDIDKLVDNRNRELEDRRRRDHNIVCFNLPEHNSPIGTENKEKDESDVSAIASQLGLQNLSITSAFRLGKKLETKIRPLKVVLENKSHRKFLLDNAKLIPEKSTSLQKRVYSEGYDLSTAKGT